MKRHKGPMLISGVIAVSMVLVGLLILSITEPSSDSVSLEPSVVAQQNTSRTAAIQVSEASKTKSVPTKTITFSQEAIPATTIPDAPQTPKDDEPITGQSAVTQSEVEEDPGYWRDRGARMMQGRKLTAHAAKYMKKGRYREATIVLANAVSSFPENTNDLSYGESLYKLGVCLRLTGKHQDAVQTLRKAMHFPAYESKAQREINLALAQIKKQTTQ